MEFADTFVSDKSMLIFYSTYNKTLVKILRCSPDSVLQSAQSHQINAAHCKPITPGLHTFGITLDQ